MTVLVDDARWAWRGTTWAHLVSDESYDELHEFARRLGTRRVGFQGDHYDIDVVDRERAAAMGATVVGSRELVRRLRESGLRLRGDKPRWVRLGEWVEGVRAGGFGGPLEAAVHRLGIDTAAGPAMWLQGATEEVFLIDLPPAAARPHHRDPAWVSGPRRDGWWSVEVATSRLTVGAPMDER